MVAALDGFEADGPGAVLVKTGTTLISKVGGASGPLYGSAFRAIGKALDGPEADAAALGAALRDGPGRDPASSAPPRPATRPSWTRSTRRWRRSTRRGAGGGLGRGRGRGGRGRRGGCQGDHRLQARKGRASYLGARSVGHQDPGATTTALILRALADTVSA